MNEEQKNTLSEDELTARYRAAETSAVEGLLARGRIVGEAKRQLPHGRFLPWVETHLKISRSMAYQQKAVGEDVWMCSNAKHLPAEHTVLYTLSTMPVVRREELLARGVIHPSLRRIDLKRLARQEKFQTLGLADDLPEGRWPVLLADPPWPFETFSVVGQDRSPEMHYPTLTLDQIAGLTFGERTPADVAADDATLFLWTPGHMMHKAVDVIGAWGFRPVTCAFLWIKPTIGLGYWVRQRAEFCLLGTRGEPQRQAEDVDGVIEAPRGRHSAKPEEAYARIERLVAGPYLELFARGPARPGWDTWGNEAEASEDSGDRAEDG